MLKRLAREVLKRVSLGARHHFESYNACRGVFIFVVLELGHHLRPSLSSTRHGLLLEIGLAHGAGELVVL